MDERLSIDPQPRPDVPADLGSTPLVTIAWRALKGDYARRAAAQAEAGARLQQQLKSVVCLADQVFNLKRAARKAPETPLAVMARQAAAGIEAELEKLDIFIFAPEGEPYSDEIMELIDNMAAQPDPAVSVAVVREVYIPTILRAGEVLRRGKAVIAVPVRPEENDPRMDAN
jgi:hypothetical protein